MRPVPVLVAVLSLVMVISGVSWLGQSVNVATDTKAPIKTEDKPGFPTPSESGPHPKVEFPETEHDFGTKPRFYKGSHKFVVENNGEAPLKLMSGDTTCQCTIGELGDDEVAPGESTTIELSWEIKQQGPEFQHSAKIHSNDPANPMQVLLVKGFIGVDLATWPQNRWSMGSLKVGQDSTFDGFVFSHVSDKFEIVKVEAGDPGLKFDVTPMTEKEIETLETQMASDSAPPPEPDGKIPEPRYPDIKSGHRITVTANEKIPVGQFSAPVTVHTSLPTMPEVTLVVSGVRPGPYQFFPLKGSSYQNASMLVDAGILDSSKEHTAGLLVICRGFDGELKLEDVVCDPPWLKVDLEPAPSEGDVRRYQLVLKFPAGLPSMVRTGSEPAILKLKTNHPAARTLNLKAAFVIKE